MRKNKKLLNLLCIVYYRFSNHKYYIIYGFIVWIKNSVAPDYQPADLDLHCFQNFEKMKIASLLFESVY